MDWKYFRVNIFVWWKTSIRERDVTSNLNKLSNYVQYVGLPEEQRPKRPASRKKPITMISWKEPRFSSFSITAASLLWSLHDRQFKHFLTTCVSLSLCSTGVLLPSHYCEGEDQSWLRWRGNTFNRSRNSPSLWKFSTFFGVKFQSLGYFFAFCQSCALVVKWG